MFSVFLRHINQVLTSRSGLQIFKVQEILNLKVASINEIYCTAKEIYRDDCVLIFVKGIILSQAKLFLGPLGVGNLYESYL